MSSMQQGCCGFLLQQHTQQTHLLTASQRVTVRNTKICTK
jgi:hypothetical protein